MERGPVRTGKPALLALTLMTMMLVLAACGGGATPTETGCFETVDGAVVSVPCDSGGSNGQPTATPDDGPLPTNTPSNGGGGPVGLQVFLREASPPCATCHTIDSEPFAVGQVGPNLSHVGSEGDADFIRKAIVDPNDEIAGDCPTGPCQPNVMPQNFGDTLTAEQLDSLVEYLVSLK
jgi:mono/diheme cytochrome c family protein